MVITCAKPLNDVSRIAVMKSEKSFFMLGKNDYDMKNVNNSCVYVTNVYHLQSYAILSDFQNSIIKKVRPNT